MRAVRSLAGLVLVFVLATLSADASDASARQTTTAVASDPAAVLGRLGSFDLTTRTDAARAIRRWPRDEAVPALSQAVRSNANSYVRYRALVLLAGFGGGEADAAMRGVLTDANDRLRAVADAWIEHHPDPAVVPALLHALAAEHSEFVRPALIRALAAADADPRVRGVLLPLVSTGDDVFRAAAIRALGDYHATYAAPVIDRVAATAGPLQDEAIEAAGKLGDRSIVQDLAAIESGGPVASQPIAAAALCLLGSDPERQEQFVVDLLTFAATGTGPPDDGQIQAAAHALAVLAVAGRAGALDQLFQTGEPSSDPVRGPVALAVGFVALRTPLGVLKAVEARADRSAAIQLLRDGFDMLSEEDFERECFYADIRHAYWASADGSNERQVAEALINGLDF